MKITLNTNYTRPTFSAKKEEIRKADDIQRTARKNFPMFSPSYLQEFYFLNGEGQNTPKQVRTIQIAQRIVYKINASREDDREYKRNTFRFEPPYVRTLDKLKRNKIGNCHEASISTISALAANGIDDAKRVNLEQKIEYVDPKTKKVIFSKNYDIDHTLIVSAMGKENPKENDFVVLDSWMGFADSISGAKARYARFIDLNKNKEDFNNSFAFFRVEHFEKTGEFLDKNNLELKHKINFVEDETPAKDDIRFLGEYVQKTYPNLCL